METMAATIAIVSGVTSSYDPEMMSVPYLFEQRFGNFEVEWRGDFDVFAVA